MSLRAMLWAFENAPQSLKSSERFVLVALADHVDDDTGQAWPSIRRLAARTGLDRRTVQLAIRQLEAQRIITADLGGASWRRADRRTSVYAWHPEKAKQERQRVGQGALFPVDNDRATGRSETAPSAPNRTRGGQRPPRTGRSETALTVRETNTTPVVTEVENVTVTRAREVEPVDNGEHTGEGFAAFLEAKRALEAKRHKDAS